MAKFAAVAAGSAGLLGLYETLKLGYTRWQDQVKAVAQTNAVLKSTHGVAGVTGKEVGKLSTQIQNYSGIVSEDVRAGQNQLLMFTAVRNAVGRNNDIYRQAVKVTADLSVRTGRDMVSSAKLLGKALNDPASGLGMLRRAGVSFTASQTDFIKKLEKSGHLLKAQRFVLKALHDRLNEAARAYGRTLPGRIDILKAKFGELAKQLTAKLIPYLNKAVTWILAHWPQITKTVQKVGRGIGRVAGQIADDIRSVVHAFGGWENAAKVIGTTFAANKLAKMAAGFRQVGSSAEMAAGARGGAGGVWGLVAAILALKTAEDVRKTAHHPSVRNILKFGLEHGALGVITGYTQAKYGKKLWDWLMPAAHATKNLSAATVKGAAAQMRFQTAMKLGSSASRTNSGALRALQGSAFSATGSVNRLGGAVKSIPGRKNVQVAVHTAGLSALREALSLIAAAASKTVNIVVNTFHNLTNTTHTRHRALGGAVRAGMPYLVGERGTELFVPGSSGTILPHGRSRGGGVNVTVNIHGNTLGTPTELAAAIRQEFLRFQRRGGIVTA